MEQFEMRFPGFGAESSLCQVFLSPETDEAAAVESPRNPSTSVTNAVEQVHQLIEQDSRMSKKFKLYTIAPWNRPDTWGVFEVRINRREPEWIRVNNWSDNPLLREAVSWAQSSWRDKF